jgi:predicted ATPase
MESTHRLRNIKVSGFKSIRALDLPIQSLNVLIGANGSGKSNFILLFRFIRELVEERMQVFVARKGGADRVLHYGSKVTQELTINIDTTPNHYACKLVPAQGDKLVFEYEYCGFDTTYRYDENINQTLTESDLADYSRKKKFGIGKYVYNILKEWRVYHFHDTSDSAKVKKTSKISDADYLREDAANLGAFLYLMQEKHPRHYQRIVKTVQLVIPFFKDFNLRPTAENQDFIRLAWTNKDSDFPFDADDLSDGSLRFICLATLLLQPELPNLILLDEPELGLHPSAIALLASLLQSASAKTQIIVATQSEKLVNEMLPENVIVVELEDGASTFKRLTAGQLGGWMDEYQLGELWNQNVFGGRP